MVNDVSDKEKRKAGLHKFLNYLVKDLLNLKKDTNINGAIENIKSNLEFRGANSWTLIFAIFIASVGLNINSIPVIIGAMLISPLMGPIIGIGYALGTYDYILIKKCSKNLLISVLISILTSTIFFLLTPIPAIQSELLARTRPSFFDVLIAFFGGAAGIVAISRKEKGKGNVIPGVAIATALMPPLCTAGFGLATQNFVFFAGALYLFIINCVFIAISTYIFVQYLDFPKAVYTETSEKSLINKIIAYVGTAVLIPSFFMAWYLQRESSYITRANTFIKNEVKNNKMIVIEQDITFSFNSSKIKLTILGDFIDKNKIDAIKKRAEYYSIRPDEVEISHTSITESVVQKFNDSENSIRELRIQSENLLKRLEIKAAEKEQIILDKNNKIKFFHDITSEIKIIFPLILSVTFADSVDSTEKSKIIVIWKKRPNNAELQKSMNFMSKRFGEDYSCCINVQKIN